MISDQTRHIGVLLFSLFIPAAHSLKEKRMVLKSLKDKVRLKFNVSIAELDRDDKWQLATCGISMIGNDQRYIDSCLQHILQYLESINGAEISDHHIEFL